MHLSDAHHFRKMVAGFCMVVAPLVLLVAMVIHPASDMTRRPGGHHRGQPGCLVRGSPAGAGRHRR